MDKKRKLVTEDDSKEYDECDRFKWPVSKIINETFTQCLDGILLIAVSPYFVYQFCTRFSKNDRLILLLKAFVEIVLELITWCIFAGVSICITVIFVMEEFYFNKNDNEKLKQSIPDYKYFVSKAKAESNVFISNSKMDEKMKKKCNEFVE